MLVWCLWSSLLSLCCYLGTLCGCGDCDECTVVCVPCVFADRVRGDGNAGVGGQGMCGCSACGV